MIGSVFERADCAETRNWNGNVNGDARVRIPSASDSSDEDDNDEMEEDEEDEGELLNDNCKINNNGSSDTVYSNAADKIGNVSAVGTKSHSSFGSNREVVMKDGNVVQSVNNNGMRESLGGNHRLVRATLYQDANAIAESNGDIYCPQFMQGLEDSSGQQRTNLVIENGRNDISVVSEAGNSLKRILSDPLTGVLMDDAMILTCGHSFGGGGIQHVIKTKACYTCSQLILEESVQPNLSLRAAVLAFRREEELRSHRAAKRRREKFEDKGISGDSSLADSSRGRGVRFPFVVTDRVVIKGNKRTPERFVGREAVVTAQCLNGWYVVKTLDNAESVKLQYWSLAKVADNPSSKPMLTKIVPNWL